MIRNNYTVYMHKNKINGKVYIGVTSQNIKWRFGKEGEQYKNQPFYKAIKKYGWNNFEHIILYENLTKKEAGIKELELIKKYKANQKEFGYNIKLGGFGETKKDGNVKINVLLPVKLKEDLIKKANEIGMSLNTYIRFKLIEILENERGK